MTAYPQAPGAASQTYSHRDWSDATVRELIVELAQTEDVIRDGRHGDGYAQRGPGDQALVEYQQSVVTALRSRRLGSAGRRPGSRAVALPVSGERP